MHLSEGKFAIINESKLITENDFIVVLSLGRI